MPDSTLVAEQVLFLHEKAAIYAGSPSILYVPETDELIVTSDRFGDGFVGLPRNTSISRKSHPFGNDNNDNGDDEAQWIMDKTWVKNQYWSSLFRLTSRSHVNGNSSSSRDVYLFGTSTDGPAPIKLAKSRDYGKTWNEGDSSILFGEIMGEYSYETGPVPVVEHQGRIYRAFERLVPPSYTWCVDYQAVVVHASLTSSNTNKEVDLTNPNVWQITPPLPFDVSWLDQLPALGLPSVTTVGGMPSGPGFLEGNIILGPDGTTIYNLLRFCAARTTPYYWGNLAVLLRLDIKANELKFDSLIKMPGGHSKFVVRPDPLTGLYITLSNPSESVLYSDQRNFLTLCSSNDLHHWTEHEVVLYDDTGLDEEESVNLTGFHYTDWIFHGDNGQDLLLGVRTAYRGANSYHNSNRILFKRIINFRQLLFEEAKA